jgi:hypothetical protein
VRKSYELRQSIVARVSPSLTNHILCELKRQRVATVANLSRHGTSLVRHLFRGDRPQFRTPHVSSQVGCWPVGGAEIGGAR